MQSPQETMISRRILEKFFTIWEFFQYFVILPVSKTCETCTTLIQSNIEQSLDIMYEKIIRKAYKGMVKN